MSPFSIHAPCSIARPVTPLVSSPNAVPTPSFAMAIPPTTVPINSLRFIPSLSQDISAPASSTHDGASLDTREIREIYESQRIQSNIKFFPDRSNLVMPAYDQIMQRAAN